MAEPTEPTIDLEKIGGEYFTVADKFCTLEDKLLEREVSGTINFCKALTVDTTALGDALRHLPDDVKLLLAYNQDSNLVNFRGKEGDYNFRNFADTVDESLTELRRAAFSKANIFVADYNKEDLKHEPTMDGASVNTIASKSVQTIIQAAYQGSTERGTIRLERTKVLKTVGQLVGALTNALRPENAKDLEEVRLAVETLTRTLADQEALLVKHGVEIEDQAMFEMGKVLQFKSSAE